ncbi:hypothetical protein ERO13_D01G067500v2 [Gossypium hirsutum]|nr:hypothetical protein ERO13_D01G067500v2 [Gossypium hirsutum]TYH87059.1 hypothetical protein ES332_D01G089100v1 [Gossypium tomentosum]
MNYLGANFPLQELVNKENIGKCTPCHHLIIASTTTIVPYPSKFPKIFQMKSISRSFKAEAFHRYLKPGALAQLRDSKINARSNKLKLFRLDSIPSLSPSQTQIQISDFDQIPRFLSKIYGGSCCLQRKKLLAPKSLLLVNFQASSQSLESRENDNNSESRSNRNGDNLLINVLNNDVVVAH